MPQNIVISFMVNIHVDSIAFKPVNYGAYSKGLGDISSKSLDNLVTSKTSRIDLSVCLQ